MAFQGQVWGNSDRSTLETLTMATTRKKDSYDKSRRKLDQCKKQNPANGPPSTRGDGKADSENA